MLQYFPFLSDLGGIFIFKEEQKKKSAEGGKYVLALILLGFNKSLAGLWIALKNQERSLESILIAFNVMQGVSFMLEQFRPFSASPLSDS